MRLFISSLSSGAEVIPPPIEEPIDPDNLFTDLVVIAPKEGDNDIMYVGLDIKDNIIYTSYVEKPFGHDYYEGIGYMRRSFDSGKTWTAKEEVYDPIHLLVDNGVDPVLSYEELYDVMTEQEVIQYGIDNPGVDTTILTDARDTRCAISPDGNYLIFMCFVAIGFNDGTLRIKVSNNVCISVRIPLNGDGSLDIVNKEVVIVEHTNTAYSGGYLSLPNGDFLYCTYNSAPSAERYIKIFRSSDNGSTYTFDSIFLEGIASGGSSDRNASTEIGMELATINDVDYIIAAGRPSLQAVPNVNVLARAPFNATEGTWLAWSYDNLDWAYVPPLYPDNDNYILRSNGLSIATMPDNTVSLFGRFDPALSNIDYGIFDYIDDSILDWPTSGYGTIKKIGITEAGYSVYLIAYYKTNIAECRQLIYDPVNKRLVEAL